MSEIKRRPKRTWLHTESNFFELWLENAQIQDIWQQCIVPYFSTEHILPHLHAQGRHTDYAFSSTQPHPGKFLDQLKNTTANGFSIVPPEFPEQETLFIWKEERLLAIIAGEIQEQNSNEVNLIRLFLWRIISDLRQKDLEVDTIHDEITSAYNQHYLRLLIEMELDRGKRYGIFFSLLFLDLDNLKLVNERHGHLVGTTVLKEVSELIKMSVRRGDAVARFGGDEFVILLLHTHPAGALHVAHRILKTMSTHMFLQEKNMAITISASIGISGFPDHGNSAEALIQKADIAMYRVKQSGKNGIEIYQGD